MTKIKGLEFDFAYKNAVIFNDDDLVIKTIHKDDLTKAKIAAGRPKDIDELQNLL